MRGPTVRERMWNLIAAARPKFRYEFAAQARKMGYL
jgi:acyl-CoA hydrolase